MIELEAVDGPDRGRRWSTRNAVVPIGRGAHALVRLSAPTVSERHTTLRFDGTWYELAPDPRDTGRVWVNQDSEPIQRPQRLHENDILHLASPTGPALRVHFAYDRAAWAQHQTPPPEPIPRVVLWLALLMLLVLVVVVFVLIAAL